MTFLVIGKYIPLSVYIFSEIDSSLRAHKIKSYSYHHLYTWKHFQDHIRVHFYEPKNIHQTNDWTGNRSCTSMPVRCSLIKRETSIHYQSQRRKHRLMDSLEHSCPIYANGADTTRQFRWSICVKAPKTYEYSSFYKPTTQNKTLCIRDHLWVLDNPLESWKQSHTSHEFLQWCYWRT